MLSWFSEGMWMIPLYGVVFILFMLVVCVVSSFSDMRARHRYEASVRRYYARRRLF
jgi:hypothetical protein